MKVQETGKKKVRKFELDNQFERDEYEKIWNDPKVHVIREEFTYDRMGHALTTIWYEEED